MKDEQERRKSEQRDGTKRRKKGKNKWETKWATKKEHKTNKNEQSQQQTSTSKFWSSSNLLIKVGRRVYAAGANSIMSNLRYMPFLFPTSNIWEVKFCRSFPTFEFLTDRPGPASPPVTSLLSLFFLNFIFSFFPLFFLFIFLLFSLFFFFFPYFFLFIFLLFPSFSTFFSSLSSFFTSQTFFFYISYQLENCIGEKIDNFILNQQYLTFCKSNELQPIILQVEIFSTVFS